MLFALAAVAATVTLALTGAMTGLFYAYSVSVMPGLDAIRAEQAIPTMQSVNRKIQNAVFFATFLLAPIAALATGGLFLSLGKTPAAVIFVLAAATYVLGAFVPTVLVNVPMNEALDVATVPSDSKEAELLWSDFSARWTRWNTGRTVCSTISLLLVGLAIFVWGRQG